MALATTLRAVEPRVVIAVCTARTPDAIAESVAALARQAPGEDLLLVPSGLAPALVEAHRRAFPGSVAAEPRSGLSLARNRALDVAAGAGAEVLAFVDDDAVVEDGWLEALRDAWRAAPSEVACIGGPIRPRYTSEPPSWLSAGITHTLTLLDRGAQTRDLDPDAEAVYGANISFRVGPLRRVGGFEPRLGHSGGRIFFGEEDAAQRALVRLGLRVRYAPGPAVRHVIPPERLTRRSFLRRRFAYGVALGLRGGRGRGPALRRTLVSASGAVAAQVRGHDALAMERAVRAAENAGVVLAPLVARRYR